VTRIIRAASDRAPPYSAEKEGAATLHRLRATTTAADPKRAQDRAPLSWTSERADTPFPPQARKEGSGYRRDPRERSEH
jgi:hypothetical protein